MYVMDSVLAIASLASNVRSEFNKEQPTPLGITRGASLLECSPEFDAEEAE